MDISIRHLSEIDLEIADSIVRAAFGLSESRLAEICRYFVLQPEGWFLATFQDEPAGVVGAINYGPFTYLGMMTVRKDLQRKGIGQALLQHMLNWTQKQGISFLRLDASEIGFPLYARFGFSVLDQALLFQLPDHSHSSNYPQHVRRLRIEDIEALVEFDTPIFGASRAALFRALLADFPDRAFAVYDKFGHMDGYLFAQSQRLGPWAARSPQDAEALFLSALTLPYDEPPLAIAPKLNLAAADLFERFGFQLKLSNRHMQRGGSTLPGQRNVIYGQTSFAMG
jgi:GNAT superfamily N-acetyltransferase